MRPLIVDALNSGKGKIHSSRDVIGVGPRTVAGVLEAKGLKPKIALAEDVLEGRFDLGGYDLLLVSGMTSDMTSVRRVVSKWKARSEFPVLIGGPVASDPVRALKKTRADVAVIGEGELTLIDLLDSGFLKKETSSLGKLEGIRGIAYNDGKDVRINPLRPFMKRELLDEFNPSTRIVKDYRHHGYARLYVEVLRGCSNYHRARISVSGEACPGCDRCETGKLEDRYECPEGVSPGCGYCSVPSIHGPPRSRKAEKIVREIRELLSLGVRRIVLSAPGFLDYGRDLLVEPSPLTDPRSPEPNYAAVEDLLSEIAGLEEISGGEAAFMVENIKGCLVTERAAEILGRYLSGTPVNIGFETGSREHGRLLGRASTPEENLRAVRRLRKFGLKPYAYFIHGLPGQNVETVDETLETMEDCVRSGVSRIIMYRFRPLPMSAFHGYPGAPPAVKNKLSRKLYDSARRANASSKEMIVGKRLRAVVAEPYERDRRYHVAYPLFHGPVILVEGYEGGSGRVVDVRVTGSTSDRMVKAEMVDVKF